MQITAIQHREILNALKGQAANQVKQYSQYNGHEQKYVLGIAKKTVKTKMGVAVMKDDWVLVLPIDQKQEFVDLTGRERCTIDVWSWRNQCQTSIDLSAVDHI